MHFLVGAHPRCVAMGEVWSLIGRPESIATADTAWCSCGETIASCRFWGPLLPELDGSGDYAPFLARFQQCYPGRLCVDSSKNLEAMRITHPAKVLHVIRDVRGWSISSGRRGLRAYLSWKRDNERRIEFLNRGKYDWLLVSYDELNLRPEPSLRRICNFLGLPYTDQMLRYGEVEHHGIKTNMKEDPRKMAGIAYDYRWMHDPRAQLPSALLPWVMRFNSRHVYGTCERKNRDRPDRSHGTRSHPVGAIR